MTFAYSSRIRDRAVQYAKLMRLHRPIGILLLLWPTLWAVWIAAEGQPQLFFVVVFVLGVVIMRSAGCIINDFADRDFDPHVERTKDRPMATRNVTPTEALILFILLCSLAFALVLLLNKLTIMLSFVAVSLVASYPFMKRFTNLPQLHLGLAYGCASPMAFAAQTGSIPPLAWLLALAVVLWVVAHDTIYALMDRPDDIRIGVKSTAILFGSADKAVVAALQMAVLLLLLLVGKQAELGPYYYSGLAVAGALALYQQRLIRTLKTDNYFRAFLNNNWFVAVIFAGIYLHYLNAP